MIYKLRWLALFAAIAAFSVCVSGCSADQNAQKVVAQAERTRSLEDLDKLITVLDDEKNLSRSVRNECQDMAVALSKELVEVFWKDANADGLAELYRMLGREKARRQIDTDELRDLIRMLQCRRLNDLRKCLQMCNMNQKSEWQKSHFVALENAYRKVGNTELKKHIPELLSLADILCGGTVPEAMTSAFEACSRCKASGLEICYGCHATGICQMCMGSGQKKRPPLAGRADVDGNLSTSMEDVWVPCPAYCKVCSGSGSLHSPCKKCVGKKYIVSRQKLIRMYNERYFAASAALQSMLDDCGGSSSRE